MTRPSKLSPTGRNQAAQFATMVWSDNGGHNVNTLVSGRQGQAPRDPGASGL